MSKNGYTPEEARQQVARLLENAKLFDQRVEVIQASFLMKWGATKWSPMSDTLPKSMIGKPFASLGDAWRAFRAQLPTDRYILFVCRYGAKSDTSKPVLQLDTQLLDKAFQVPGASIGKAARFRILKRDSYRCQMCGKSAQSGATLEVDHKTPRAKGGSNHDSNLWTLCFDCNRGKSAHDL